MTLMRPLSRGLVVVVFCSAVLLFASLASAQQTKLQAYTASAPATDAAGNTLSSAQAAANSNLVTFKYTVVSSRDGNTYSGAMVGQNPFGANFSTTTINTPIVPVVLTTNAIATKITFAGKAFSVATEPGVTVFNPTAADDACLSSPNDVPLTLTEQSPIFQSNDFKFGAFDVGTTQYIDAFQRGNFWQFVGGTPLSHHP